MKHKLGKAVIALALAAAVCIPTAVYAIGYMGDRPADSDTNTVTYNAANQHIKGDYAEPERDGYEFAGWSTNREVTDPDYSFKASDVDFKRSPEDLTNESLNTANKKNGETVYAVWARPTRIFCFPGLGDIQIPLYHDNGDFLSSAVSVQKATKEQFDASDRSKMVMYKEGGYPVYGWEDADHNYFWYSEAKRVYVERPIEYYDEKNMRTFLPYDTHSSQLKNVDISGLDFSHLTSFADLFAQCGAEEIKGLDTLNTGNATHMTGMFAMCRSLKKCDFDDLDMSKVTTIADMFVGVRSLTSFSCDWNLSSCTDASSMFSGSHNLVSVDLSGFKNFRPTNCRDMFHTDYGSMFVSDLKNINCSGWDVSNLTDCCGMFFNQKNLETIDLSGWHLNSSCNTDSMFGHSLSLKIVIMKGCDDATVQKIQRELNSVGLDSVRIER